MSIIFDSIRPINAPTTFGRLRTKPPKAEAKRTALKPATATTAKPAPDVCRLTLSIRGVAYSVRPTFCDPSIGAKAFRLRKTTGDRAIYHILAGIHGAECDCADFVYRHHGFPTTCKHVKAMRATGLLT